MSALWADDRADGYLAGHLDETPPPPIPIRDFESEPFHEHYPEGDPYTLYELDDRSDAPHDDDRALPTPREGHVAPEGLTISAIWGGLSAAALAAAGVAWLIVRSRRRESPTRRAARRAAAHGSELAERLEEGARRGLVTSLAAAARRRRRAETLLRR